MLCVGGSSLFSWATTAHPNAMTLIYYDQPDGLIWVMNNENFGAGVKTVTTLTPHSLQHTHTHSHLIPHTSFLIPTSYLLSKDTASRESIEQAQAPPSL